MDSGLAVIKAVVAKLQADVDVVATGVTGIYTDVPQKTAFPYVSVVMESQPFASASFSGQSHQLRIQCFSTDKSAKECLEIRKACLEALDRKEDELALEEGTVVICQLSDFSTFFQEDDGRTWQAVGEIEVVVQ